MRAENGLRLKFAFLLSGGTGFALYYLLSLAIVRLPGIEQEVAAFAAVLLSIPPTYLLQRNFAFRYRGEVSRSLVGYCLLQAFNAVAIAILAWFGRMAGLPPEINFLVSGLVVVLVSYVVLSRLVFPQGAGGGARGGGKRIINAQYNVAEAGGVTDRISTYMRRKMYARFIALGVERGDTILDVGVTGDQSQLASNYLEAWYPHKDRVTACGVDDASFLESRYPGLVFVRADGRDLPFDDGSFDWVHSSAVLEHVGSGSEQAKFVSELHRVSRKGVFATTPNRWFPVEFHTVLPLVHWLPKPVFRRCLRRLGHEELALEKNLNLLGRDELAAICLDAGVDGFEIDSVALCLWPSNLLLSIPGRRES